MGGLDGAPVTEDLEDFQFYNSIFLDVVMTGTLSSGSSTTTTLPATMTKITGGSEATSRTDDAYNNGILTITGGTGSGQSKRVTDYSGQTKVCTVESAWSTPPDSTSTFTLDLTDYISKTANDGTYTGKYLGITIDDPDNPDLYLQIAWIGAGDYLQPGYDIGRDSQSGVVDNSERTTAADQNLWINQRNRFQVASFTWPHLTEYEAKVRFKIDVGVKAGASSPVVFTPFVENSFRSYTDTIIGYLDAAPMPRQVLQNYTGTSYSCDLSIRGAA
jgi:hypothetical protein